MQNVDSIRFDFAFKYRDREFVTDKSGVKCLEIIGAQFIADETSIFGEVNEDYVKRELMWYKSKSLNVNDIPEPVPAIWKKVATPDGRINSNYGWCIWHEDNGAQYWKVINELQSNRDSRRAQIIYTRPSIWEDYNKDGMSDFICTTAVQYFIRNNKLVTYVTMRSNDAWAGYRNDYAWQSLVASWIANGLGVEVGDIIWNVASLHIYEPQFYLVQHFIRSGNMHITKKDFDELYKDYEPDLFE